MPSVFAGPPALRPLAPCCTAQTLHHSSECVREPGPATQPCTAQQAQLLELTAAPCVFGPTLSRQRRLVQGGACCRKEALLHRPCNHGMNHLRAGRASTGACVHNFENAFKCQQDLGAHCFESQVPAVMPSCPAGTAACVHAGWSSAASSWRQ